MNHFQSKLKITKVISSFYQHLCPTFRLFAELQRPKLKFLLKRLINGKHRFSIKANNR